MTGPHTILVVEDDLDTRDAVADTLRRCGYAVITAGDGRDAVARVQDRVPDLIVLDWLMPVMGGGELLRRLAADPAHRAIPVLVLSAVDRAIEVGTEVAAVLHKPVRMRTLIDVIDRLCGLPRRPDGLAVSGRFRAIGTTPPETRVVDDGVVELAAPASPTSSTRPLLRPRR